MIFDKAIWYFVRCFVKKSFFLWDMIDLFLDVSVQQELVAVHSHIIGIIAVCNRVTGMQSKEQVKVFSFHWSVKYSWVNMLNIAINRIR